MPPKYTPCYNVTLFHFGFLNTMILVTGGTGFIGQALIRMLVEESLPVRTLIRPSSQSPNLPRGLAVEAAISSINDERNLRAALVGVDTVFHLVGAEWLGVRGDLHEIEVAGAQNLVKTAKDAGVKHILYLSHLGADRGSAYPILQAKGIAEQTIRRSGINFTILRSSLVYGPQDHFTTSIVSLLRKIPFYFPMPGSGNIYLQPIWVEDLVTCLIWSLDKREVINQILEVGGPEYLSLYEVVEQISAAAGIKRKILNVRPSYLRLASVIFESLFPRFPLPINWLDYLAMNRTAALDSLPRHFGLLPAHFSHQLDYLSSRTRPGLFRSHKSQLS